MGATGEECPRDTIGLQVEAEKRDLEIIFAAATVIASVVGVGVALGTMIRGLRSDMDRRMDGLDTRLRTLEAAQNRLSGLLEGLGLTGQLATDRKPAS